MDARVSLPWLVGGGEMADRVRAHDWAATPLGPLADWDERLQGAIAFTLASPLVASVAVGPERRLIYNDAAARLYGERHPAALGAPLSEAFADSYAAVVGHYDRVFAGESVTVRAQPLAVGPDGGEVFDAYLTPVRDAGGSVIAAQMVGLEIGNRVRAERERAAILTDLRESEARHRLLLGSVAQAVWETDGAGVVVNDSPSWRAFTGQTPNEWLGYGWLDAIHPDDRAYAERQWREAVAARRLVDAEFRLRAPDGGWRWTNVRAAPVLDPEGTIVKWAGMNIDVDARRRAEEVVRASEERKAFLLRLSDALRPLRDSDALERTATWLLGEQLGADRVFYATIDAGGDTWSIRHDYSADLPSHAGSYPLSAFQRRRMPDWQAGTISSIADSEDGGLSDDDRAAYAAVGARAAIGIPLVRGGRFAALLAVNQVEPRAWTAAEIELARETAERTWAEIERARIAETLREREARRIFLLELNDAMREQDTPDAVIAVGTRLLGERLQASRIVFAEIDEARGVADIRPGWTAARAQAHPAELRLTDFGGPLLDDLRAGRTVRFDDTADPSGSRHDLTALQAVDIRAGLSIPLIVGGRFTVNLNVHQHEPRCWTDEEVALTAAVAERLWGAVQRARAEQALQASEQRLQLLTDATSYALYSMSSDWGEMRGLQSGGFLRPTDAPDRQWLLAYIPESDRVAVNAAIDTAIRDKTLFALEHRVIRSDGTIGWTYSRAVPLLDEQGRIREWFGAATDVTARRASEARLRTLMAGIPQLVWRAVEDGQWTWSSPQWTAYTGLSVEESRGNGWLRAVHEDDRARASAVWQAAAQSGGFELDARLRRHDGSFHWFQTRATAVHDEQGGIIEWLGTSTDVDDLHELQQRQVLLVAELQHRVRNVLGVVRAVFARTVEAGGPIEELADHFKGRLDALARTQVIVTQSPQGLVNLENLIRDELLSVGVSADGAKVTIDGPEVALPGKAAESIGMAIHELTTNAVKYGAIFHAGANLRIGWRVNLSDSVARRLDLIWEEQGVPAVELSPRRYGFGRELIEEALPYRLRAETKLEFRGGGVRCSISMPLPDPGASAASNRERR